MELKWEGEVFGVRRAGGAGGAVSAQGEERAEWVAVLCR